MPVSTTQSIMTNAQRPAQLLNQSSGTLDGELMTPSTSSKVKWSLEEALNVSKTAEMVAQIAANAGTSSLLTLRNLSALIKER